MEHAKSHDAMSYGGWKVECTEGCTGGGDKSTRIANNMYLNKQNQTYIENVHSNQNYRSHYSRRHISDWSEYTGTHEDVVTFGTKIQTSLLYLWSQINTTNAFRVAFSVEKQQSISGRKGLSSCGDKCACQYINPTCLAFPGRSSLLQYVTENAEEI